MKRASASNSLTGTEALGKPDYLGDAEAPLPICPVDRIPRRRRNKICIAIILLGGLNFAAYTAAYAILGGDAHNGYRKLVSQPDGTTVSEYFVGGHYIRNLQGIERPVSKGLWIYSYLHSISVLVTSAAMIISMLVLARPDILATMRDGWIKGQTLLVVVGGTVLVVAAYFVVQFTWEFVSELSE